MLGTFSFEPYFKSYRWFIVGSLEFLEIAFRSLFPFPCLSLSALSRRRCRAPPARRAGSPPANSNFAFASRWHPRVAPNLLHRPLPRAGALSTLPRAPAEPSSRHLAVAVASLLQSPRALSSRAHEHYKYPIIPFRLLFHLLPTPTPQNTAAAPQNAGELTLAVEPTPPPFLALN